MAQAMTAPKDIAFVTTRGVSYHIKPQLGWGVVHVTEEKM
ncbi:hypothetical protein OKN36_09920 [Furfurilactobacillus sp. OKN36]